MIRIFTIIAIAIGLTACQKIPPYDGEGLQAQAESGFNFTHFNHNISNKNLHGVHTGKSCNPAIIFIHGTPGDWKAWGRYLGDTELGQKAFIMAVDRLGFAGSNAGTPELSLAKQASAIIEAAKKEHKGPFLLIGHSYGGPVQTQIAIDYPEDVSSMIILAGAIDPIIQKSRWYHHLSNTWIARSILPQALTVTTKEMLSLPNELKIQQPKLQNITTNITFIQGGKDWLVPPGNADYATQKFNNAQVDVIRLPKQGHFIPWQEYDLVNSTILQHLPENHCE